MTNRLLLGYLAITVVVLAILELPLGIGYARNERQELTVKVERDAVAMASLAQDAVTGRAGAAPQLRRLADRYAADTGGQIGRAHV